ncbi:YncE family protein [Rhodococcus erythropolis]|uniref:YncE family protein n=1 Tax=Rhodococcus erythropolis TaxID=1833 RepID=UPI0030138F2B
MSSTSALHSTVGRFIAAAFTVSALIMFPAAAQANPSISGSTSGPDGLIWMPNYGANSVVAFDPDTLDQVKTIPSVGDHPLVIKMLPDQSRMFVGNFGPATWQVSVIDTATESVIKQIPTLGPAYAVSVLSKDGRYLYVPTGLSVVQVIDTQSLEIVRTLPIALPPGPAHIEISPDGRVVYAFSALGTVTPYDSVTGAVLSPPIFLGGFVPGWGAISEDGNTLYAVNFVSGLTTVDVPSWQVTRVLQLPIAAGPLSATLSPDGKLQLLRQRNRRPRHGHRRTARHHLHGSSAGLRRFLLRRRHRLRQLRRRIIGRTRTITSPIPTGRGSTRGGIRRDKRVRRRDLGPRHQSGRIRHQHRQAHQIDDLEGRPRRRRLPRVNLHCHNSSHN